MVATAGAVRGKRTSELKRIEKLSARQVTFAKRRKGLFKKAHEIATLCDAEIAVILFSSTGKLYEFSSSRMTQVIQRHKLYAKHAQNQKSEQTFLEIEMKDATDSTEDIRRNTSEQPTEWKKLERQCGRLKQENSTLKAKEASLMEENERLRTQLMVMSEEQGQLHKQAIQPPAEADFWDELCQDYIIPESSLLFRFDMPAPHISASGIEPPLPNSTKLEDVRKAEHPARATKTTTPIVLDAKSYAGI